MAFPSQAFVQFKDPVPVSLNARLVNGSLPQLRQYGLYPGSDGCIRAQAVGVTKDGTVVRLNSNPITDALVPQVVKRVINNNDGLEKTISTTLKNGSS